jgi:hypothetical protein
MPGVARSFVPANRRLKIKSSGLKGLSLHKAPQGRNPCEASLEMAPPRTSTSHLSHIRERCCSASMRDFHLEILAFSITIILKNERSVDCGSTVHSSAIREPDGSRNDWIHSAAALSLGGDSIHHRSFDGTEESGDSSSSNH